MVQARAAAAARGLVREKDAMARAGRCLLYSKRHGSKGKVKNVHVHLNRARSCDQSIQSIKSINQSHEDQIFITLGTK